MNIESLINELTLDEKIAMLAGNDFWTTVPVERLGIPSIKVTDGPNGARGDSIKGDVQAVCYPCGTALAATWDLDLMAEIGRSLAKQVKSKGSHILLAPTVNIHRTPIAGRNFECYSEDPYLSSRMAVTYIGSLQEEGVGACIKHFVANDQEYQRNSISAEVDERTLHEIYLPPFRAAVAEVQPWAVMSSYNRMNGVYCSEDPALLIDLLKNKWGFEGIVISDWFGSYSDNAAAGGLDLEMPGKARFMGENVKRMVESGELAMSVIDDKIARLLGVIAKSGATGELQSETLLCGDEEKELVRRSGAESIVLLKNANGILPLTSPEKIAVIGASALTPQVNGGGSANVAKPYIVSPLEAIRGLDSAEIQYAQGCPIHKRLPIIEGTTFDVEYRNDPSGDVVHKTTTSKSEITWFGDIPDGVEDGFTLTFKGTLTPIESGTYRFTLSGVGGCELDLGSVGSLTSQVDPSVVGTPFQLWDNPAELVVQLEAGVEVPIRVQYDPPTGMPFLGIRLGVLPPQPDDPIADAVQIASEADVAVVVVGITDEWESEGFDRESMKLPGKQNELVARVAEANPNTIVVVNVGAPVEMPWIDDVAAVMQSWLLGQEQGNAIADVLFGKVNPSAKLPTTFPVKLEDNPAYINYPGDNGKVRYGEGIFVGYRYYEKKAIAPLFPFGFGLSYTTFDYANLSVEADGEDFAVSLDVTNTGDRAGSEVVQLYLRDVAASVVRPEKELKGFVKVKLAAGETKRVAMTLKRADLAFYSTVVGDWVVEAGEFELLVGSSSAEIHLQASITIEQDANTARLSLDTPVVTLLEDPDGLAVLESLLPELLAHPALDMAKSMTLPQIATMSSGQLTAERLSKVAAALKEIV